MLSAKCQCFLSSSKMCISIYEHNRPIDLKRTAEGFQMLCFATFDMLAPWTKMSKCLWMNEKSDQEGLMSRKERYVWVWQWKSKWTWKFDLVCQIREQLRCEGPLTISLTSQPTISILPRRKIENWCQALQKLFHSKENEAQGMSNQIRVYVEKSTKPNYCFTNSSQLYLCEERMRCVTSNMSNIFPFRIWQKMFLCSFPSTRRGFSCQ